MQAIFNGIELPFYVSNYFHGGGTKLYLVKVNKVPVAVIEGDNFFLDGVWFTAEENLKLSGEHFAKLCCDYQDYSTKEVYPYKEAYAYATEEKKKIGQEIIKVNQLGIIVGE